MPNLSEEKKNIHISAGVPLSEYVRFFAISMAYQSMRRPRGVRWLIVHLFRADIVRTGKVVGSSAMRRMRDGSGRAP